jgi:site-specific DNA-cytosine methylase
MKIGEAANVDAYWATPAPRTGGTPYPDIQPLMPPAAFGSVGAWWLIGRWLADGSLTFGSGRCDVSICCGFHEEDELAGRIDSTGQAWKYRALRTAALFHVTDREARDWLHEHFGHGARDKQLPGWVLALCRHDRQDLLNGYVSGDGSVGRRTRCDTVSHRLAVGVRLLAESLGHRVSLFRYEQHSRTIEGRELKNVAPVWAVTWETAGSSRETYQHPTDQQAWSRIRSIEDGRENVQVFNLEVEEDESYVAEGIVVHNCTNHSLAKGARRRKPQAASLFEDGPGGDAEQDKSRATMWDVVRFAEAMLTRGKPYKAIVVENVTDAFKWGANDDGGLFSSWLTAMDALGYEHEIVWLNSMLAHGEIMVPQSRDRMYPVFWLKGIRRPNLRFHPTSWCTRCEKVVAGVQTWKRPGGRVSGKYGQQYFYSCPDCHATAIPGAAPADAIIDWALPAQRIGDRKRPLAENTVKRIRRGLERLTSEPFAIRLLQSGAPRTLTLPLVTLTTRHDMAMVLPVAGNTFERTPGNRARDARLVPLDTVHGIADKAVVVPPMGSVTPRSTLAPAPTQTTTTRPALVQAP